jgi:hypothetical protein
MQASVLKVPRDHLQAGIHAMAFTRRHLASWLPRPQYLPWPPSAVVGQGQASLEARTNKRRLEPVGCIEKRLGLERASA